jgi:two-component system sensor histidine kinase KdpD
MKPSHDETPRNGGRERLSLSLAQRFFSAITGIEGAGSPETSPALQFEINRDRLSGVVWAFLACLLTTALALPLRGFLAPANMVMLYLLAVVLVAVRFGGKPGILASILAVLAFDFFLVQPYQSLDVTDTQYLLTFAIMLAVALIISNLTANLRLQAAMAFYGERRASALFDLSKALSAAVTNADVIDVATRHIEAMFHASVVLLLPDQRGKLQLADTTARSFLPRVALHGAQAVYDSAGAAAHDHDNDPKRSDRVLYLPLRAPMRIRGVLAVMCDDTRQLLLPEQQRLLQTCAAQIALALERVHYVEVAGDALVSMESERLRNSLLSAISHDVRTPLTAIVGLSSTLASRRTLSSEARQEITEAIQEEALRMSQLVTNLLDMAKLHAGRIRLNRQWQLLEEVVGTALGQLSRALDGREVEVNLPPGLPLLSFDAVLIERVLCNLVDNAAKHTPPGTPIRISAALRGDVSGGEVQVSVEDDGPGIAAGMEDAIFTKFTRSSPEPAQPGFGLGLAICRAIVEAHGGTIRVDRDYTDGARFVFTMPLGTPPGHEELPLSSEGSDSLT